MSTPNERLLLAAELLFLQAEELESLLYDADNGVKGEDTKTAVESCLTKIDVQLAMIRGIIR